MKAKRRTGWNEIYFVVRRSHCVLGCEKLKLRCEKVVLEEDGAEIDDDESLQVSYGSVLMILQPGEKWSIASEQSKRDTAEQKKPDEGNSFLRFTLRNESYDTILKVRIS